MNATIKEQGLMIAKQAKQIKKMKKTIKTHEEQNKLYVNCWEVFSTRKK